jgi:hypothetical protein
LTVFAFFVVIVAALPWDDGYLTLPPDSAAHYDDAGYRLLALVLAAGALTWAYRGRVEIGDKTLVIRYTLRTSIVPLAEIERVTPTRDGLAIVTRHGRQYSSPAFIGEKAPLARWLSRRTQSDELADAIMAARPPQ